MKYAIIIPDGAADDPLAELGGRTPLEAAATPNMDRVAMEGRQGLARTVPDGFESGSDVATMCLLGYDPRVYHTGRAPLPFPPGYRPAEQPLASTPGTPVRNRRRTRIAVIATTVTGAVAGLLTAAAYLLGQLVELIAAYAGLILGVLALAAILAGLTARRSSGRRHCPGC